MKHNRSYHPAFALGYWTIFVCLAILAIAAMTNIVPLNLQPPFIFALVATTIVGAIVATAGYLKSVDRGAFRFIAAIYLVVIAIFVILYLTTR